MTAAARLLDQLCHFTAQSLESLELADHFQLVKLLGRGSYGEVSLALHRTRGTAMALKCFRRDSTCLLTFLREYNLSLAFCTHPSLTAALGIVFATPSHYVFAQQPCLFGDLYDVIVPEVGLEQRRAQGVASQVGGALSHLHSLGFVHRDVKPENVFLCDGDCRWVKLGDFGMVKAADSRVPCVWYSSPYCTPEAEEARSGADRVLVAVDPSADSWALGILIYAMLMGSLPWSETASDNAAYVSFLGWRKRECPASDCHQGAPQFSRFTPLSAALLRSLLHPLPGHRGRPEEVDRHLGGSWKLEKAVSG